MRKLYYSIAAFFLLTGCAGVEVNKLTAENPYQGGVRFYRPQVYLLVTKDLEYKTLVLPNMTEEYVVRVRPGIGAVKTSVNLTDGWNLSSVGAEVDSKVPETITALTGVAGMIMKAAVGGEPAEKPALKPGLYKIIYDPQKGGITGFQKVDLKLE